MTRRWGALGTWGMAVAVALAVPAIAAAALYKTGTFATGTSSGSGFRTPGVSLQIHHGSFLVENAFIHETCDHGAKDVALTIRKAANLGGPIDKTGHFSVTTHFLGGTTIISGHVVGSKATVRLRDTGPDQDQPNATCHGDHTFQAKLLSSGKGSGGTGR